MTLENIQINLFSILAKYTALDNAFKLSNNLNFEIIESIVSDSDKIEVVKYKELYNNIGAYSPIANAKTVMFQVSKRYVDLEIAYQLSSKLQFDKILQIANAMQDKYKVLHWKSKVVNYLQSDNLLQSVSYN